MSAKTFLPWSLLVILGTAVVTYAVAHRGGPEVRRRPSPWAPSFLRAIAQPRPRDETVLTLDMATARPEQLEALVGQRVRLRVVVDSTVDEFGDRAVCNVLVCDPADEGTVELYAGQKVEDGMTVEGIMRVLHHPVWLNKDGTRLPGYTEYRLVDAGRDPTVTGRERRSAWAPTSASRPADAGDLRRRKCRSRPAAPWSAQRHDVARDVAHLDDARVAAAVGRPVTVGRIHVHAIAHVVHRAFVGSGCSSTTACKGRIIRSSL